MIYSVICSRALRLNGLDITCALILLDPLSGRSQLQNPDHQSEHNQSNAEDTCRHEAFVKPWRIDRLPHDDGEPNTLDVAKHIAGGDNKPSHLMVVRYQVGIPCIVDAWHAGTRPHEVVGRVLETVGDVPDGKHNGAEDGEGLHHQDRLPPLTTQERRVRDHARNDLDYHADGVLACRPYIDLVHAVFSRLEP